MTTDNRRFETLALHGGSYRADPSTGAVAVPIYQTTSYQFQDTDHASRLFALEEIGNIYTRVQNPTTTALEDRVAALEGGSAALAVASGQTASAYSVLNFASSGDNIVSSTDLYGGTWTLFAQTLKQFGVEVRFVDPLDPENFRRATDARTKAYYAETLPNPKLNVFPIKGSRRHRPFAWRAAHRRQHGGAANRTAVRARRGRRRLFGDEIHRRPRHFDRRADHRWRQLPVGGPRRAFPAAHPAGRGLSRRDLDRSRQAAGTHRLCPAGAREAAARPRRGAVADQLVPVAARPGDAAVAAARSTTRTRSWSPTSCPSGRKSQPCHLPRLQSGEVRRRADAYLKGGYGGLVGFELKGGVEAGRRFIDSLKLFYHVANIGDARSLAIHPASTTHQQLIAEDQLAAGVTPGYVRLSVGIEHPEDIIGDLAQAIDSARPTSDAGQARKAA